MHFVFGIDFDGNVIERTKQSHPYSYDQYVIWSNHLTPNGSVYTDRLYQQDSKKYNRLCKKYFDNTGQYWSDREPIIIESFLCEFLDQRVRLARITEHCNQSSGYPLWNLHFLKE